MTRGASGTDTHLYTPDSEFVVGAMVTHQVGSVGRAAVLHLLLLGALISPFYLCYPVLRLLWSLVGETERNEKLMQQLEQTN